MVLGSEEVWNFAKFLARVSFS